MLQKRFGATRKQGKKGATTHSNRPPSGKEKNTLGDGANHSASCALRGFSTGHAAALFSLWRDTVPLFFLPRLSCFGVSTSQSDSSEMDISVERITGEKPRFRSYK